MLTELTLKVPQEVVPELKMLAEKLAGMVNGGKEENLLTLEEIDHCVAVAVNKLKEEKMIRSSRDYAWIMMVMNEQVLDDFEEYYTALSFIDYLEAIGIDDRPGKSTLYDNCALVIGDFPKWVFSDEPAHGEATRRINVGKRFLNAYMRAKRALSEGFSEK